MADQGPERKKKRGIVRTVLGTALDAAVFSTALGYSAYKLWKSPPTQDDVDALVQQKRLALADIPHADPAVLPEAPPPYSELVSACSYLVSQSNAPDFKLKSPAPDSVASWAFNSDRPHSSSTEYEQSTFPPSPPPAASSSSSSFNYDPSIPLSSPARDPFADLSQGPIPDFLPYSSPKIRASTRNLVQFNAELDLEENDDDADFEEDDEMRAVSDRLKSLIDTGREALASRPREWSGETASSGTSRSRLSTTSSLGSTITAASNSPRKPSPLSQFTSRFESTNDHSGPQSPRRSLPAPAHLESASSQNSVGHSRRSSLDNFSRIPTSTPALYASTPSNQASQKSSSSNRRGHRHTQSYGGLGLSQSPDNRDGREEGIVEGFEQALQRAKSARSSLGGRG
ncbi:hypothetical protein JCM16303_006209 [Sporobolomyces ruberrimus]